MTIVILDDSSLIEKAKSDIEKSSDYDYVVVNKNMYGAVIEVMDIILKNIQ